MRYHLVYRPSGTMPLRLAVKPDGGRVNSEVAFVDFPDPEALREVGSAMVAYADSVESALARFGPLPNQEHELARLASKDQ